MRTIQFLYSALISALLAAAVVPAFVLSHEWAHCAIAAARESAECTIRIANPLTFMPGADGVIASASGPKQDPITHAAVYLVGGLAGLVPALLSVDVWLNAKVNQ